MVEIEGISPGIVEKISKDGLFIRLVKIRGALDKLEEQKATIMREEIGPDYDSKDVNTAVSERVVEHERKKDLEPIRTLALQFAEEDGILEKQLLSKYRIQSWALSKMTRSQRE